MHWLAHAPANIALIKYMGKKNESSNLPDNASLSYTLDNLISTVQLECLSEKTDVWEPLNSSAASNYALSLPLAGQKRFIDHLSSIKTYFGYSGSFLVKSTNNFPHSSGLASSASSFAALTRCAVLALSELTNKAIPSINEQAQLSRQGSGSSCRSFYTPWALWQENEVSAVDLPYKNLLHEVIIISAQEKKVSSSEAHRRVKSSTFYASRSKRAEEHLTMLVDAFKTENWNNAYQICWREFQDMHHLFSTCAQPFSYLSEGSLNVLNALQKFWDREGDGPIVTMDAGPNIHLLYRPDQVALMNQLKQEHLLGHYDVL
ncbi:MAG: diphosphomevalonate/mevalonate 3,5-bisphosphate decarboxylase family protein [Legionellales bacterium]